MYLATIKTVGKTIEITTLGVFDTKEMAEDVAKDCKKSIEMRLNKPKKSDSHFKMVTCYIEIFEVKLNVSNYRSL